MISEICILSTKYVLSLTRREETDNVKTRYYLESSMKKTKPKTKSTKVSKLKRKTVGVVKNLKRKRKNS